MNWCGLDLKSLCFFPSFVSWISCAIPICAPFGETLHFPPAAVTVICNPQQDAKIFFSYSKSFLTNLIWLFTSLLLSSTRKVLPVNITPSYFFKVDKIFKTDSSFPGSTIFISQFGWSFSICNLKFCDWATHPALLKFKFSSFVLPSTINSFNLKATQKRRI